MDQKNIKQRDVLDFDKFAKAHETAMQAVMLKKDESAHPGAHAIKGEDLYVKNDANPYKAMGIPHNEEKGNTNDYMTANQVDVFHNRELTTEEKKKIEDAYGNEVVTHHQVAFILDESIDEDMKEATLEEAIIILAESGKDFDLNNYAQVLNEAKEEKAEKKEEPKKEEPKEEEEDVDPDDAYRDKYVGKTVILNGDSAKVSDEEGIGTIKSKHNELILPWREIDKIITTKDGNFKMKVEKKEEEKEKEEKPKEEKKEKKAEKKDEKKD